MRSPTRKSWSAPRIARSQHTRPRSLLSRALCIGAPCGPLPPRDGAVKRPLVWACFCRPGLAKHQSWQSALALRVPCCRRRRTATRPNPLALRRSRRLDRLLACLTRAVVLLVPPPLALLLQKRKKNSCTPSVLWSVRREQGLSTVFLNTSPLPKANCLVCDQDWCPQNEPHVVAFTK